MEHVCARCTRLSLGIRPATSSTGLTTTVRSFSTSRSLCDKDDSKPSSSSTTRRPFARNTPSSSLTSNAFPRQGNQTRSEDVVIRRTSFAPRTQNASGAQARTAYQAGARTGGSQGTYQRTGSAAASGPRTPAQRQILQRNGSPRPGQSQLLVRKVLPIASRTPNPGFNRGGPPSRTPPASEAPPSPNRTDRRVRRAAERSATRSAEDDDPNSLQGQDFADRVNTYVKTIVDPPVNPTTELPHTPGKDLTGEELRKDWPPTPLTNAGLVESVQQRIEWLAHRLPHGYQTPNELALQLAKGFLTRFESAAERDEVLAIAKTIAQRWADRDTEKAENAGEVVEPLNMDFDSLVDRRSERQGLADTWVRGAYPEATKQKIPFLDHIVRNLNNNVTVTKSKNEQFMQTVQSVMVSRHQAKGNGQDQKTVQK